MKRNQSGFTLIEIAIVLVIIGLLLGGVLKGQELINSARVKNLATDFRNIPLLIYGYQDKYKALPGDDRNVGDHIGGICANTTPGDPTTSPCFATTGPTGNGVINGMWDSTSATDESIVFWQHVRVAGLAAGETVVNFTTFLPTNAAGGTIGITNGTAANLPITGLQGSYIICSGAILGKLAKQLDNTMDDGNPATGSMRIMAEPAVHPAPVNQPAIASIALVLDATPYTVCMGI